MDAILNYQNPIIGDPDMMVIDGQFQKYIKSDHQNDALGKLAIKKAERLKIPFFLSKSSASEDFYLYKDKNNGVIMCSTFEEKDKNGRNVGFTYYYKNAIEVYEAKTTLESFSVIVGMHPNRKDVGMFEKLLRLYSKHSFLTKYAGVLLIAVIVLVVVLLIVCIYNYQCEPIV